MGDESLLLQIAEKLEIIPFESLSGCQRIFMAIWDLEAEVNNGGFSQYFQNQPGRYALETRENLKLIGAENCARLLDKAIIVVNLSEENWEADDVRREIVMHADENIDQELDRLDSLFFQYPDDLSELLTRFAKKHAAEFGI